MATRIEEILLAVKTERDPFKVLENDLRKLEAQAKKTQLAITSGDKSAGTQSAFRNIKQDIASTKLAMTELGTARPILTTFTAGLVSMGAAYIGLAGAQKLWQIGLESKRFQVLRDNFRGSEKDIDAFRIATARTVSEANLIKLSNQATDLGITLRDQAILFSLAEDASDKYGTSVEEGFQRVVLATEGNERGLKSIGIQKEVYQQIVKDLAKAHGDEIDKLDAETQKQIRLEAIVKASGVTYEQATNKVQDAADIQESLWIGVWDAFLKYNNAVTNFSFSTLKDLKGGFGNVGDVISSVDEKIRDFVGDLIGLKEEAESGINIKIAFELSQTLPNAVANALKNMQGRISEWQTKNLPLDAFTPPLPENFGYYDEKGTWQRGIKPTKKTGGQKTLKEKVTEIKAATKEIYDFGFGTIIDRISAVLIPFQEIEQINARIVKEISASDILSGEARNMILIPENFEEMGLSMEDALGAMGGMVSESQNIANILGIGADTFVGKMLSGFSQITSLASSIFSIIAIILKIGSGGALAALESGGYIPKFPLGGYLQGASHTAGGIPIEAEGGEYIIRKSVVDSLGVGFFDNINKTSSAWNRYADGGMIRARSEGTPNITIQLSGNMTEIGAINFVAKALTGANVRIAKQAV